MLAGMDFWYRKGDRYIGERVARGKYEEYETKLLLSKLNKNSVVVDVGANIGYYTIQMAKICKRVYAFEPETDNFEILKKNVEENKLNNVILINSAVGSKKEKIHYYKNKENYGDGRVYKSKDCHANARNDVYVNCLRLDDTLLNEQKISLIKIDTQGWEPEVIEGAINIIKRDSPILFMEYWPSAYKVAKLDAKKMMKNLSKIYKNIWQIDTDLNIFRENIKIDKDLGYADLYLTNKNIGLWERFKDIKAKKLIKKIIGVK